MQQTKADDRHSFIRSHASKETSKQPGQENINNVLNPSHQICEERKEHPNRPNPPLDTTRFLLHCFLIQTYYTLFFIKIQAFCKKKDVFVDYDNIYVNIVMSTSCFLERLFLSFSTYKTISSVFNVSLSLNIVFAVFPSFLAVRVNLIYPDEFFVHFYNLLFRRPCLALFFSAL